MLFQIRKCKTKGDPREKPHAPSDQLGQEGYLEHVVPDDERRCENKMWWSGQHLKVIWMWMLEDMRIVKHTLVVHLGQHC